MKEKIIKKKGENPLKPMNRPMDMGSLVKQFKNLDVYQKVVPLLSFIEIGELMLLLICRLGRIIESKRIGEQHV